IVSARSYAGGWNDGSRLATVESLVDHRTLAIDRSIFVQVPSRGESTAPPPYPPDEPDLLARGTRDKLLINGRFYSDKSPVPAFLMAGVYQGLQWTTGLRARERPDRFCYWMTLGSSGLAYVIAVWSIFQFGVPLRLPLALRLALTASFGLATVALTYTRHVNNHILLLGVATLLLLGLTWLGHDSRAGRVPWPRLLGLGTLAGLGYTIDLGAGPVLLACTMGVVAYRTRRLRPLAAFVLMALPWLALHHAANYAVGGTFRPANSVPQYLQWPGSPFTPQNMTGTWNHPTIGQFITYAAALLVGKRGFLGHNLPLFLALPGIVALLRWRTPELPEILYAACWSGGTWLAYALLSTNYSGVSASIRWFVPLLAPGYYVLAIFLREHPRYRRDFLVLSAWGAVVAGLMWWKGPWMKRMVPFFWPLQVAALLSWILCQVKRKRQEKGVRAPQAG
ncbi:MAG TPA: hypothetical protein VGA50_00310, partial [Kiloniellales bacterium]